MTEKELLKRAAKAAGINLRFVSGTVPFSDGPERIGEWNPLKDDGDALRLAVKLNLHVLRFDAIDSMTTVRAIGESWAIDERDDNNSYAATRRAIVRAAAEIGKRTNSHPE